MLFMCKLESDFDVYGVSRASGFWCRREYNSGWLINLDNDVMAEQDRDYTGGVAVTLSGRRVEEYPGSLEGVRNWLDELLRVDRLYAEYAHFQMHSVQYGAMQFTPGDIIDHAPIAIKGDD
jgi:hypothetical protein